MAAPTRVSYHVQATSPFLSTGTSKTCTGVTFQVGDRLVVQASAEQHGTSANVTPTLSAGAATWIKYGDVGAAGTNNSGAWSWIGTVTTAGTNATVTLARPNGSNVQWGFSVTVCRGVSGVGQRFEATSGTASSAPLASRTCAANSLILGQVNDWNATDGTSRTWRTINGAPISESTYARSASTHTVYGGFRADSGAAGNVDFGLTAPATQRWVMVGFELLGTSSAGTTQAAAGTVPASTTATASALARLVAAGVLAATSTVTASAVARLGASGMVAASSTVTGSATVLRPTTGSVAATSTTTGAADRLGQSLPAAGTVAATSDTTGAVTTARLASGGTVGATSTVTATARARLGASGTAAASTSLAGTASVLGGPVAHPAAGTVSAASTTSATVRLRATAAGTVPLVTTTAGEGLALYRVGGSVDATSSTTGSADIAIDPDQLPVVEVGTMQPARFSAAPALSTATTTATAPRFLSGTPLPSRYTRRT